MYTPSTPIRTISDIETFLDYVYNTLGLNYHPDDSFVDYLPEDTPSELAETMDARIEECFEVAGEGVYDIGYGLLYGKLESLRNH